MYLELALVCGVLVTPWSMKAPAMLVSSRVWYESVSMVRTWVRFGGAFNTVGSRERSKYGFCV